MRNNKIIIKKILITVVQCLDTSYKHVETLHLQRLYVLNNQNVTKMRFFLVAFMTQHQPQVAVLKDLQFDTFLLLCGQGA